MAQLPEGNGRPFLLWQTAQLFDAPAEYDSAQAYPAEIMKPAGYILETPPTTHDNPLTTVSRPVPISVPPFKVDLKPPRFDVQWRWWEDEASFILRAFAVESIKRLVQFRLYHDDNLPRSILRSRDANTVTAFLNSLLSPNDGTVVTELTHYDRVEKLLSLCRSKDNEARPWSWFPTSTPNEICYEAVARDINDESYLQFKAVRFEDWAHYSLGYPTPSVEWFLMQHSQLSSYLMAHFNEFPDQAYKYVEVEKKLVVLEVRFNQIYHRGSDVKWDSYFEAESPLLDEFFEASSPRALARSLTHSDDRDFTGLCLQSFVTEDSIFRRLTANWDNLCTVTEECCLAYPDLIDYFKSCVQTLPYDSG
ncbi:hypothetical protein RJZ57_000500 [Blastomyces gilchristii]